MTSIYNVDRPVDTNMIKSKKLLDKYPDKCPIIIKSDLIKQTKYLVPRDITVTMFQQIIRKRIDKIHHSKAIFLFFMRDDKPILQSSTTMIGNIFDECKSSKDGFLYVKIDTENTFG